MTCLKNIILFTIACFTFAQFVNAVPLPPDRVILKTGEVYSGEIILQNDEIILLRTVTGERFQFPVTQVKSITKITDKNEEVTTNDYMDKEILPYQSDHNFCSVIEVSGGLSSAKNSFSSSTSGDITLSFGTRSIARKSLFIGGGAGFSFVSINPQSEISRFIPVYIRLQSNNLIQWRTSPYFSLDAGYALPVKTTMSGGIFTKLSGGIVHRMSFKTSVQLGIFARIQQFSGILSENRNGSIYTYSGSSAISSIGALAGFQF